MIPSGLRPYFQEYDPDVLDLQEDADLILQRSLEYGTWEEVRWLFQTYGLERIRTFLKQHGERWLRPVTFNYWRKLLKVHRWRHAPLATPKGELWKH